MRPASLILITVVLAVAAVDAAQELPLTPGAFAAASVKARRETLARIALHELPLPPADAVALIRAGLVDADARVRRQALNAVVTHAAGPFFLTPEPSTQPARPGSRTPPADPPWLHDRVRETWLNERPLLGDLRPAVLAALADADPDVRRDGVLALASLDFDGGQELTLREQTVSDLGAAYGRESEGHVRAAIVKSLAAGAQDGPELRAVLLDALDDLHAQVRQQALLGIERLPQPAALPKLVQALGDADANLRSLAAHALGAYGASPESVRALERALTNETDLGAKAEIERTLSRLRRRPLDSK